MIRGINSGHGNNVPPRSTCNQKQMALQYQWVPLNKDIWSWSWAAPPSWSVVVVTVLYLAYTHTTQLKKGGWNIIQNEFIIQNSRKVTEHALWGITDVINHRKGCYEKRATQMVVSVLTTTVCDTAWLLLLCCVLPEVPCFNVCFAVSFCA